MTNHTALEGREPVRFERIYEATAQEVWDLWTTKGGFEAWWGPQGFRVEVRRIDPRPGGELFYDMIADAEEMVRHMEAAGRASSHETRGRFVEVEPLRRLKIVHAIDFIPGVEPYDNTMVVELEERGSEVRMTVTIEPHRDAHWTQQSAMGFESQLTKVPAALASRRG